MKTDSVLPPDSRQAWSDHLMDSQYDSLLLDVALSAPPPGSRSHDAEAEDVAMQWGCFPGFDTDFVWHLLP